MAGGPPAREFKLRGLDGGKVQLSDYRDRIVLLFFISDQCGVCHEETPTVEALYRKYRESGFEVVGILADEPAPASALRNVSYPLVLADEQVKEDYHIPGYPIHYLIGRDQTVQAKHRGWSPGREQILEAEVRQLLGGEDLNDQDIDLYLAQGSWEGHWIPGTQRRVRSDQLLPYLSRGTPAQREYAIEELGRRRSTEATAMLASIAVSEREEVPLRRKALAALRAIGDPMALGTFERLARSRQVPGLLRAEAVEALGVEVPAGDRLTLLLNLLSEQDPNVRLRAAYVLGARCVGEAREALLQARKRETFKTVQDGLDRVLQRLEGCDASAADVGDPDLETE